ncbi:MAG: insulinase family protein [Burkholderia sp.]|jgi:zinc protease|nr:pitrilysin family protein [Burkholderia sp.]MCA4922777.1 insulinase family protein [Methylobacterium sp.]MCA3782880.1 insulinase family protein [Burkholderia sp.]MCA3798792.1 insulinase family protein [Burkholderia sp.]MCA3802942.1 insulinase family protein [Burkholderia sp.]MCA3813433.1 insulinase family protein [Burkholderia sp.]
MTHVRFNHLRTWFVWLAVLCLPVAAQAGIADRIVRSQAGSITLLTYSMSPHEMVSLTGVMPLGDADTASKATNPAVPLLTGMLLQEGSTRRDKVAISALLESLGAQLSFQTDGGYVGIHGQSLTKDLPTLIDLMAEQLRLPAFKPEELAKAKSRLEAAVRNAGENPSVRATEALNRSIYPDAHLNAPVPRERMLEAIASATLDDIKAFHQAYYGPAHMTLVVVGGADPRRLQSMVTEAFPGWSGGRALVRQGPPRKASRPDTQRIAMGDKESVSVMLGQAIDLRANDADYLPLSAAVNILGNGFTGRLMAGVRDKEGLTYGIRAGLSGLSLMDGGFVITSSFAPPLLDKGVASTRRILDAWWKQGVTQTELDARKDGMIGRHQVAMETTGQMAAMIAQTVLQDRPLSDLDTYPERVRALTVEQVNTAIRTYLAPDKMTLVEAGTFAEK